MHYIVIPHQETQKCLCFTYLRKFPGGTLHYKCSVWLVSLWHIIHTKILIIAAYLLWSPAAEHMQWYALGNILPLRTPTETSCWAIIGIQWLESETEFYTAACHTWIIQCMHTMLLYADNVEHLLKYTSLNNYRCQTVAYVIMATKEELLVLFQCSNVIVYMLRLWIIQSCMCICM